MFSEGILKVCNVQSKLITYTTRTAPTTNFETMEKVSKLKKDQINFSDTARLSKFKSMFVNYSKFAIAQETSYTITTFGK